MQSALLWTINDFLCYANLSGYSTKGKFACPNCQESTCFDWLHFSHKRCYMGHQRFLDHDHLDRKDSMSFNGCEEHGTIPPSINGFKIVDKLRSINVKFGKKTPTNPNFPYNWKKFSIFLSCHIGKEIFTS
ncbi:hypothetical protein MA16_Dca022702 [Dendrobium catenatum]|uniref:Uncharacterized protein n=1 Tax=Dendrobium catenatum TaxID=906689 RepID=A0A2I0VM97_9ASPA|nr:hypothetical protein MA16_Dca022702 [Dendrobium catenatum]